MRINPDSPILLALSHAFDAAVVTVLGLEGVEEVAQCPGAAVLRNGHHGGIQGIGQGHFLPFLQGDVARIGARQRVDILVADRHILR